MSGFKVNFSVNNQLSTPSIHAAPFAQRPAAGQPGRVFIDSDNPSTGIYRDTGTTWVAIGNPSSPDVDTLQIVTDRGNTTTNSITVGAATTPSGTVDVRRSTAALNGTNDWAFLGVNTPTIPSGASFGVNYVNAVYGSQAQTFAGNATIGNTGLNSAGNFINTLGNSASGTITVAQGSGTIRAIAGLHAGIYYNTPNAMTFTHVAGIRTLQPINSGAVGASVTNYYGVQIADSTPSSGTISYTNRYGIYQEGASDVNYFAGSVGIGKTNPATSLDVNGTIRGLGDVQSFAPAGSFYSQVTVYSNGSPSAYMQGYLGGMYLNAVNGIINFTNNFVTYGRMFSNGNWFLGTSPVDAGYKLDVNGSFRADNIILQTSGGYREIRTSLAAGLRIINTSGPLWLEPSSHVLVFSPIRAASSGLPLQYILLNNGESINTNNGYGYNWGLNIGADGTSVMQIFTGGNVLFQKSVTKTSTNQASALIEMVSTTQGFLPPRMTDTQITAIATPAAGLMVYSTTQACPAFYDGTGWRKISHSAL